MWRNTVVEFGDGDQRTAGLLQGNVDGRRLWFKGQQRILGKHGKAVRAAQLAAEAVAAGDLTQDIQVEGRDELSQMLQVMKDMQLARSGVVRDVSTATSEVASNSGSIAFNAA